MQKDKSLHHSDVSNDINTLLLFWISFVDMNFKHEMKVALIFFSTYLHNFVYFYVTFIEGLNFDDLCDRLNIDVILCGWLCSQYQLTN